LPPNFQTAGGKLLTAGPEDRGTAVDSQYERSKNFRNAAATVPETVSLYLDGYAAGKSISFIIDSGSAATIVSKKFWLDIPEDIRPPLQFSPEKMVFADGEDRPIEGRCVMSLVFGMLEVEHSVMVADLDIMGLLGSDFMRAHSCQIDFGNRSIIIDGHEMGYREERSEFLTCRIKVAETVTVPAGHEMIVRGRVIQRGASMSFGTVEASPMFSGKHGLFLGRTLIRNSPGGIPVRLMNPSDEPRTLHKGTVVGLLHPVVEVQTTGLPGIQQKASNRPSIDGMVPSHLDDLYKRSSV